MSGKVAVVTGSNKGIGFAIVRALLRRSVSVVYLTSRDAARGSAAVAELRREGLHPAYHQLDVADESSVTRFRDHLQATHGGVDILVNNAAIAHHDDLNISFELVQEIININYRSALTVQKLLYPLLRENARVLNISSDCGHLSNIRNEYWLKRLSKKDLRVEDVNEFVSWYLDARKNNTLNASDFADNASLVSYRVAKVALSALTMIQQKELNADGRNISVNSMHPGLVRTDMTGGVGFYSNDDAAKTPVDLVLDAPQDLKGAYIWYDGKVLDWYDHKADYYFKCKTLSAEY